MLNHCKTTDNNFKAVSVTYVDQVVNIGTFGAYIEMC